MIEEGAELSNAGTILAIANQKGGVGKTTTAVNLSASLAVTEARVLLVDLDPQANATSGLGLERRGIDESVYAAMDGTRSVDSLIMRSELPTLDVLPSGPDLYGIDMDLAEFDDRLLRLKHVLHGLRETYDWIIIDCPPSLSLLTLNALTAADSVMIPMQCEYYALEGLSQLMRTIELVRASTNPALSIEGVVLTMFDGRNNLARQVMDDVKSHFGDRVFKSVIPRNVRLSEAPSFGKPVLLYDINSRGSQGYLSLAQELVSRGDLDVQQGGLIE